MGNALWKMVKSACFQMEDSTTCTCRYTEQKPYRENKTQYRCNRCGKFIRRKDDE